MSPRRLTTSDGKRLVVDVEHDVVGRAFYAVRGVGTFTLQPESRTVTGKPRDALHVHYGRVTNGRGESYRPNPDAPRLFGVTLVGGAVFDPARATGANHWWLACRRHVTDCTSMSAPDGTSLRAARIVAALVADQASRLVAEHNSVLDRLDEEIARLQAEYRRVLALRDEQAALLA